MFDDQPEPVPQRTFRKSENSGVLESDLFYLPSEEREDEEESSSSELNSQLKEQVASPRSLPRSHALSDQVSLPKCLRKGSSNHNVRERHSSRE